MGGRGSSSASANKGVSSYRIVHGATAIANLRNRGASDKDIAAIYDQYHANRAAGMGKRDARIAAENELGFGSKSGKSVTVMSEQEYLNKAGVGSVMSDYMVDKVKLRNGTTQNQRKALEKEATQARNDYAARRTAAKAEYASKVKAGEVRPPTNIESMMKTAHGHQDNAATQAARMALKKRGYDWRTGKRL